MTTFIAGGTGFMGRRLVPLLAQRGEEIVCMDINPQTADFGNVGNRVKVVRGDVSQFDEVRAAMTRAARPRGGARGQTRSGPPAALPGAAPSARPGPPSSSTSSAWTTCSRQR